MLQSDLRGRLSRTALFAHFKPIGYTALSGLRIINYIASWSVSLGISTLLIMLDLEENQSEQNAQMIINSIRKALKRGDLQSAARRLNRIKELMDDRQIARPTFGEMLLTGAEVARACGKTADAEVLLSGILQGSGGLSMETFGRAKRLRARTLLDQGNVADAKSLAATADRYVMTGLVEERIENIGGRELRVNTPVSQKFLDRGEYISFETYFLLAEIAVLESDWAAAVQYIDRADEKYSGPRIFPELEFWRGILEMAKGESLMEYVEPVLTAGNPSTILVARVEAVLNEPYRTEMPVNEFEYERYQTIGRLAREAASKQSLAPFETPETKILSDSIAPAVPQEASGGGTADRFAHLLTGFTPGGRISESDLSRMSMLRLNEVCEDGCVTGLIVLIWNEAAVREGIQGTLLHETVRGGGGVIYCRNGQFVDAELLTGSGNAAEIFGVKTEERGIFSLKQMLLIVLGGGSEVLSQIQSGRIDDQAIAELSEPPEVFGLLKRDESVADRPDCLEINSKLNFILDVSRELDEFRHGPVVEEEINWDADWGGSPAAAADTPAEKIESVPAMPAVLPNDQQSQSLAFITTTLENQSKVLTLLTERIVQPIIIKTEPAVEKNRGGGYHPLDLEIDFSHKFGKKGPIEVLTAPENQKFTGIIECYWKPEPLEAAIQAGNLPVAAAYGYGYLYVKGGQIIDATLGRLNAPPELARDESDATKAVIAIAQIAYAVGVSPDREGGLRGYQSAAVADRIPRIDISAIDILQMLTPVELKFKEPAVEEDLIELELSFD